MELEDTQPRKRMRPTVAGDYQYESAAHASYRLREVHDKRQAATKQAEANKRQAATKQAEAKAQS